MELMDESLTALLECCSKPASDMKVSLRHKLIILLNVAHGLQNLHSCEPPIPHCRLSSNKVLLKHPLTDHMQVKISDTGVVHLIRYNSQAVTKFPGNDFMPIEYVKDFNPQKCKCPLDVFCFGGIVLHSVTEQWPKPIEMQGSKSTRSNNYERSRRCVHIEKIDASNTASLKLKTLIESCLDDQPKLRRPIQQVLQTVANILGDLSYAGSVDQAKEQDTPELAASGFIVPVIVKPKLSASQTESAKLESFKDEFKVLDDQNKGFLRAEIVSADLKKVGLSDVDAQKILKLCDRGGAGCICMEEFCVARWIAEAAKLDKNNSSGSLDLPTEETDVSHNESLTENDSWKIPQTKLNCYQAEFNALDEQNCGSILVERATVFLPSLEAPDMKTVWALFGQDKDGYVSINEYCAAKWIALRAANNVPIPYEIPSQLRTLLSFGKSAHKPDAPKFSGKHTQDFEEIQAELKKMKIDSKEKVTELPKKNDTIKEMEVQLEILPDPAKCKVTNLIDHVVVNQIASVFVVLNNSNKQAILDKKESIRVMLSSTRTGQATELPQQCIEDENNGLYSISIYLSEVGEYNLSILVCDAEILRMPHRIRCVSNTFPALDPMYGPKVKPLQNLKLNCYFNSVLQTLNQTQGLSQLRNRYKDGVVRQYVLSFSDALKKHEIVLQITGNTVPLLQELITILDRIDLEKAPTFVVEVDSLLKRLADSSNQQRFGIYSQEDSHELMRHLLYKLKMEEVDLVKKGIYNHFGVTSDPLSQEMLSDESKKEIKRYLRVASKVSTPIDEIFSGEKLNTVICRECDSVTQTLEPFYDISLGIIKVEQDRVQNSTSQYQQQYQYQSKQTRSNTTGRGGTSTYTKTLDPTAQETNVFDSKRVRSLLKRQQLLFLPVHKGHGNVDVTDLERSLVDHTAVDNMDEDNMFICKDCTDKKVLILHIKRFIIGEYVVKKDPTYVSFPHILDVAPYCSNTCLQECSDAKSNIFYGLYAVIEHKGVSLRSGHYIAYVRRRPPPKDPEQFTNLEEYDLGIWFYTSDTIIRECQWDDVKKCEAYLLFYELLPRKHSSAV